MFSAPGLRVHPRLPLLEVPVAVALELGPAVLAVLQVCNTQGRDDKELEREPGGLPAHLLAAHAATAQDNMRSPPLKSKP